MKRIVAMCPHCAWCLIYKNWFYWVFRTPFHFFSKRKIKCPKCGKSAFVKGVKVF